MKKIIIRGHHKSLSLAKKHATALARDYNGSVTFTRHVASGAFGKGRNYTFLISPREQKMWRIIVSFPYLVNQRKSHKKGSPDQHDYKVIFYASTKQEVLDKKTSLRKRAANATHRKAVKQGNIWVATSGRFHRNVNVSVQRVVLEKSKLGKIETLDE